MNGAERGPSVFAIFRNRRFRLVWSAQLVSTIGSSLLDIAAAVIVYRVTGSAAAVGLMLMATTAPSVVLGLFAGVFVDRYDRKTIMIGCDVVRGLLVLAIPLLISFGIAWLYVAVAAISTVRTFFRPAYASVVPDIVVDEELPSANSLLSISTYGSTALGFAAGGFLASAGVVDWAFGITAATFGASALLLSRVAIPGVEAEATSSSESVMRNLGTGFAFLWRRDALRSLLLVGVGVGIVFGLRNALLLPFADRALGATEWVYGVQLGLSSVAFVIAALVMASRADRLREGQWLTIALVGMGIVGAAYAMAVSVPWAIVLLMMFSFLNAPWRIAALIIVQRETTREVRGRVNGTFAVVRDAFYMTGMALVVLAEIFDVRLVMLTAALVTLALGVVVAVMPGLGQPAAEWRRAVKLLRGAAAAPGLQGTRGATPGDFDALALHLPVLTRLTPAQTRAFAAESLVADAPTGTVIVRRGEPSDASYFVIEGRAVAGWDDHPLETLGAGDHFGEIAALTGVPRTADVVAEEPTRVLQVPASVLRRMTAHPDLNRLFLSRMTERMVRMDMVDLASPLGLADAALLELRSAEPVTAAPPATTVSVTGAGRA